MIQLSDNSVLRRQIRRLWIAALLLPATLPAQSSPLAGIEHAWLSLRTLHDQLGITRDLGAGVSPRGIPRDSLLARLRRDSRLMAELIARAPQGLDSADRRALARMESALATIQADLAGPPVERVLGDECLEAFPEAMVWASLDSVTARTFACYGEAARRVVVDRDTLDRLSVLGLLGRTGDPERRRRLFLALGPIWRAVNGDDGSGSPYRSMARRRETRTAERAAALGVPADSVEPWLVRVLEAWRATLPDTLIEPWDFHYLTGQASRDLSPRIPLDSLRPIAERFYRDLGADPAALGVHFDLVPRPGKYPISFANFGARDPIEPWIFTSYRIGGLDNLAELLHEVGHAVHIAAIRTRPAFTDWPDSDTYTEAIADLAALELYEPDWQRRYLGATTPLESSLRSKYAGIVLDVAWALFEIRAHREPERSPNRIWTELTREYLRIRPHPDWSWWALRGQLVNSPGYMLNYALGAILIADLREALASRRGSPSGNRGWYEWVAPRLYRQGLEVSAREVISRFLGRSVSPAAILRDLARIRD